MTAVKPATTTGFQELDTKPRVTAVVARPKISRPNVKRPAPLDCRSRRSSSSAAALPSLSQYRGDGRNVFLLHLIAVRL